MTPTGPWTMSDDFLHGSTFTISHASFLMDMGKQCRSLSDAAFAASDLGLYCLLTECSKRNE